MSIDVASTDAYYQLYYKCPTHKFAERRVIRLKIFETGKLPYGQDFYCIELSDITETPCIVKVKFSYL